MKMQKKKILLGKPILYHVVKDSSMMEKESLVRDAIISDAIINDLIRDNSSSVVEELSKTTPYLTDTQLLISAIATLAGVVALNGLIVWGVCNLPKNWKSIWPFDSDEGQSGNNSNQNNIVEKKSVRWLDFEEAKDQNNTTEEKVLDWVDHWADFDELQLKAFVESQKKCEFDRDWVVLKGEHQVVDEVEDVFDMTLESIKFGFNPKIWNLIEKSAPDYPWNGDTMVIYDQIIRIDKNELPFLAQNPELLFKLFANYGELRKTHAEAMTNIYGHLVFEHAVTNGLNCQQYRTAIAKTHSIERVTRPHLQYHMDKIAVMEPSEKSKETVRRLNEYFLKEIDAMRAVYSKGDPITGYEFQTMEEVEKMFDVCCYYEQLHRDELMDLIRILLIEDFDRYYESKIGFRHRRMMYYHRSRRLNLVGKMDNLPDKQVMETVVDLLDIAYIYKHLETYECL